jgi:hypothetical protein
MPNATVGADAPASPKSAADDKYHALAAQIAAEVELKAIKERVLAEADDYKTRASREFGAAYHAWLAAKAAREEPEAEEEVMAARYNGEIDAERRLMVTPAAWPDQFWSKLEAFEMILSTELIGGPRQESLLLLATGSLKADILNLNFLCGGGAS